jgi:hypothetical protein
MRILKNIKLFFNHALLTYLFMNTFIKSKSVKAALGLLAAFALVLGASSASAYTFNTNLKQGMSSSDVKELQMVLNTDPATQVASSGAGSPGAETMYFGALTKSAVMKFQAKYGISPVAGYVGPLTRAKLNTMGSGSGSGGALCPNGMTFASNCTTPPSSSGGPLCPNGMTLASNCTVAPNGTSQTGPVSAMLSSTTPASGVIVATQATADLAHFTFTGTGTVTNVTLQRIGVSADSTLSNVYLFDGATRLTDASSVSNNGMITFNIPAGIFTVNGSKTISVKSDILTGTSGQTVGVKLVSFMAAGSTVANTVNISGNVHSVASATLAGVSHGTVTPSGATLNPGTNVTLWQDTFTITTRDVLMKRLALRNVGSAPSSSFQNFKLFVNGVQVSSAAGMDSTGYVTFDMSSAPVTLVAGSRIVRIDADIVSGASRTVQLSLRQAADADFVDSSFGVNVTPSSTPWVASSASTISGSSGGTLTIEKDVTSPSINIVNNGTDVNLGTFKVTAYGEPIKIETLTAGGTFDGTQGSTSNAAVTLRNGRILINGVQYGSTATLVPAGTSFSTNYTVYPGTPVMVEIHADIYDNDGTGALDASDTILAKILAGSSNAQRIDSLGSFNAPAAAVSANTLTLGSSTVTVSKDTTYTNQTVVLPQTGFKVGDWNVAGSSIEDVLLTTLSFDVDEVTVSADDFNEDDMTNMYAVVKNSSGTIVYQTSPISTVSATSNDFSLNYTLPKNASVQVELYANLGATVTAAEKVKTDLGVTYITLIGGSSTTASDVDGQTLTAGSGSLTITADASTPDSTKFADNQTVRSASFKFASVNSGYKVTDITLTIPAAGATVVETVNISSTTGNFSATRSGAATVVFSGLNWDIPANQTPVLNVDLVLGTVSGINGGTSGASLLTTLTAATAISNATGVSAAATESDPAGNVHYAYAAVPTITKQTLPSSALTNGTVTLARFTVNTNGTGTIAWKEVLFDITKTGGGTDAAGTEPTITSPTLWDADTNTQITAAVAFQNANGTSATTCVESDTTCELMVTVGTKADDNVEKQVSGSKTYEIRATIGATLATGDFISVVIPKNLAYSANGVFTAVDNDTTVDDASFVWSDVSAQSHDTGTADWTNEALMVGLPTSSWTLTK